MELFLTALRAVKEAAAQCVAVRHSKKGDLGVKPIAEFLAEIAAEVKERRL